MINFIKNLFSRKTKLQKLEETYKSLLEKSFKASKTDRKLSDRYMFEANQVKFEMEKNGTSRQTIPSSKKRM